MGNLAAIAAGFRVLSLGKGFNLQAPSGVVCGSGALHDETFELDPFPPPLIASRWQRYCFQLYVLLLFFDTGLVALPWAAVGVSGVDSSAVDGRCACAPYLWLSRAEFSTDLRKR